ncbi:MAG TPA: phosphoenolpyruvate--protein phosphotransferase [Lachnoclostridium phytofermentans]|uniref:Phosphoenolpyruvate-protein phosphotransferase n=1 Tax=Lachnoclostridium phytofermentans TaxID=66219 RepID=A0A3D2XAM2_9FIRM|nr:phosphoenolpyruvate--protein phosphotransferase [Lachnoclostridium phytofermentans]
MVQKYTGKSVYGGIALGKVLLFHKKEGQVRRQHIEDVETEILRVDEAREKAKEELQKLYDKAVTQVGEQNAMIFEVHQIMLEDQDYVDSITYMIKNEQINAEYAVASTGDNFAELFSSMDDEYMKERAADVKDISNRLIKILQGKADSSLRTDEPYILVADDLAPSETLQLDKTKVLAFVTRKGSTNSHTAILARMMNIPALIGVEYDEDCDGKDAIVDGYEGILITEPTEGISASMKEKQQKNLYKKKLQQELKGKDNVTKDGKKIDIFANIGSASDVASVLQNDAGGIGLFRSEFLYLGKDTFPSEEEQFQTYKTVLENMAGKKVVIRTLDIGADKQADYFGLDKEENPAMGYRAIRICLIQPDIFRTQLRAIYRASIYGTVAIMYPMIISVDEVKKIKEIVQSVKDELTLQGIPFHNVEQGIMIETPAAVMISDLLAKEVDFFSIGTNDLTQYTLAIDRQNPKLDFIYDPHHPAILRMIQMVIENGHKGGCWVGICGELGGDITLIEKFLRMGLDEVSVSPNLVLSVRDKVRNTDLRTDTSGELLY